jgi:hypothetical protein
MMMMVSPSVTLAFALLVAADAGAPVGLPRAPAPLTSAPSLLAPLPPPRAPAGNAADDRPYELRRAKDGTGALVYDGPGFTARIARDGAVRFDDHHFAFARSWSLLPVAPLPMPRGRPSLQSTFEDLMAHRDAATPQRDVSPDPRPQGIPLVPRMSPYRPDPSEACQYPRDCYFQAGLVLVGVGGTFDLTDELIRLSGQDPNRREKARFLAATRDLRGGLSARAVAADVRRASAALSERLRAIACDETRSVAERRAFVEALRREVDSDGDDARAAVAAIDRFVRARGGADGGALCP